MPKYVTPGTEEANSHTVHNSLYILGVHHYRRSNPWYSYLHSVPIKCHCLQVITLYECVRSPTEYRTIEHHCLSCSAWWKSWSSSLLFA